MAYIPFLKNDIEGSFFGFKWLSSFMYSFGIEVAFISIAMLMNYSTNFMMERAKPMFIIASHVIAAIGFYFVAWIFIPDQIFTKNVEIVVAILLSIICSLATFKLIKLTKNYINFLKEKIRNLVDVIINDAPHHVKDLKVWDIDVVEPTLDMLDEE